MTDFLPPHSPTSEAALLSALLVDPENLERLNFDPSDFYFDRNRWVYEAMRGVKAKGMPIDYVTVCAELDARGQLTDIGGNAYILQMLATVNETWNAQGYADIIKDKGRRRRIILTCNELAQSAFDGDSDVQGAVSRAVERLSKSIVANKGAQHISNYVSVLWDEIAAAAANPLEVFGITTGFSDWDRITGGRILGETVKLSGEPGVGKTLLAAQTTINAAQAGHPAAIYSLEISALQMVRRSLSQLSKVNTFAMRSGRVPDNQWDQLAHTMEQMTNLPIYISDVSHMTTMDVRVDLLHLQERYGVSHAMIDYEGLLTDEEERLDDNARSKLVSSRVHAIGKDLGVALLVIDDMNKSGISGQTKGQASLAGSARKLHDADQIIIMRKDPENKKIINLTWEKMREGDPGRVMQLVKTDGYPAFEQLAKPANAQNFGRKS